ncbi:MAG TPA: hypothetical protein VKB77_11530 [Terriglobales bacterium]|nr:hypothetical protein [Terriglobales bacterium]
MKLVETRANSEDVFVYADRHTTLAHPGATVATGINHAGVIAGLPGGCLAGRAHGFVTSPIRVDNFQ